MIQRPEELARKVGTGDHALGSRLLDVQRERVAAGADAALAGMFTALTDTPTLPSADPIGPETSASVNAEESTETKRIRSTADLPDAPPITITLTRLPVPDPVPANAGKSPLPLSRSPPSRHP
ncbi:hypothetical protein [Streptomyces sp. NPDC048410]|uniref:hypothetical protein n=1 Tax=Streptomyces sp. NPDC048410 TaxID=3365545 RepID=UPI0037154AF4